jgi:hypothetical protein
MGLLLGLGGRVPGPGSSAVCGQQHANVKTRHLGHHSRFNELLHFSIACASLAFTTAFAAFSQRTPFPWACSRPACV